MVMNSMQNISDSIVINIAERIERLITDARQCCSDSQSR